MYKSITNGGTEEMFQDFWSAVSFLQRVMPGSKHAVGGTITRTSDNVQVARVSTNGTVYIKQGENLK